MKIICKQIEVKEKKFGYNGNMYEISEVLDSWRDIGAWWEDEEEKRFWRVSLHNDLTAEIFYIPNKKKWYLYRLW